MLPAVLIPAIVSAEAIAEQDKSAIVGDVSSGQMPVRTPNNAEIRDVLKGKLATGESLEVHQTTLLPGRSTSSPTIVTSILKCVDSRRNGGNHVNGTNYRLGPGSWDSWSQTTSTESRLGITSATYFVVAVGRARVRKNRATIEGIQLVALVAFHLDDKVREFAGAIEDQLVSTERECARRPGREVLRTPP